MSAKKNSIPKLASPKITANGMTKGANTMPIKVQARISDGLAARLDAEVTRLQAQHPASETNRSTVVRAALTEYLNKKEESPMTAREFLKYAGADVTETNLHHLTRYLDSSINFAQFPDAAIPDGTAEDADEPAGFQEYLDRQED